MYVDYNILKINPHQSLIILVFSRIQLSNPELQKKNSNITKHVLKWAHLRRSGTH